MIRRLFSVVNGVVLLLFGLSFLGWWGSRLPYHEVLAHLNSLTPDGNVESYTLVTHARILSNLRTLAGIAGTLGVFLFIFRKRVRVAENAPAEGRFRGFMADLFDTWKEYRKRTSKGHAQFVVLLLIVGAVLRAILLFQPITYDEAFTFTYYASRPFHVVVSDYSYPNNHVLHTVLAKLFTMVFGIGKVSLRMPAFLAGVACLPLFYFFVRAMFNRYIGIMALAMVAASGPLMEYSALARGYSLTWLFMIIALVLGRHLIKKDHTVSAMLIGVSCALGMWAVPTMIYPAIMIHVWLLISLMARYDDSLRRRLLKVLLSGVVFVACTMLFYLPVIMVHGLDQLMHHNTQEARDWNTFVRDHWDRALDLYAVLADASSPWVALLGFLGLLQATFISSKFRALIFGLLLGCVPLVLVQAVVGPPRIWLFSLFIFHLSSAIALFYLLKLAQEKLLPKLGKRQRTAMTALVLLVVFGWPGMHLSKLGKGGMADAEWCAEYVQKVMKPTDKIYIDYPWDSPVEFHLMALGVDRGVLYGPPPPGSTLRVAVGPDYEHTLEGVLRNHEMDPAQLPPFRSVQDRPRLKIFAAPLPR